MKSEQCKDCGFWTSCENCDVKFAKIDQELKNEYTLQNSKIVNG